MLIPFAFSEINCNFFISIRIYLNRNASRYTEGKMFGYL